MEKQETKQEKMDRLWQEIFRLQKEAMNNHNKLCLLDQLQFNDVSQQIAELRKEGIK